MSKTIEEMAREEKKLIEAMRCPGCGYLMAKYQWDALYSTDISCPGCEMNDLSDYEEALV